MRPLTSLYIGKLFFVIALLMLILTLVFGTLAAHSYISPGFWKDSLGFTKLRPLHVSSALFWILLGASGGVICASTFVEGLKLSGTMLYAQLILWIIAITGIFWSYFTSQFGGREYWEFPPVWALPIGLAWLLFVFNFIRSALKLSDWPVYIWMWITGLVFFLFTFTEHYLWLFPYFRSDIIKDMTIQWKSGGAMVGAWNQLIYGLSFFLMQRVSGDKTLAKSKIAFLMYFLGLVNLLFNWAHHIYTLPTESYVRYVGYVVSMTEWIILIRIIRDWRLKLDEAKKFAHQFTYKFLMAADVWVFFNLILAIAMSIPAINVYTHGTHITVAHAMGTTIGINSMILLAGCVEFMEYQPLGRAKWWFVFSSRITQIFLFLFWIILIVMGLKKGIWQMESNQPPFQVFMYHMHEWFRLFNWAGTILMLSFGYIATELIIKSKVWRH